jgi:hypothetical protein
MFLKFLFTCLLFFCFFKLSQWQNEGFSLQKIQHCHDFNPDWEIVSSLSQEELATIFNQPFDYLSKGAQTFVFASRDGKYVIKFFRFLNKYATPLEFLPFKKIQRTAEKRSGKLQKDFNSYKIAFEQLQEETGLVFLHLNQTNHLKTRLTLYDKMKSQYKLCLDEMGFILQRRADPFYPTLTNWIKEGKTQEAKKALSELVHLISKRMALGISDKDPDLKTNFGFLNGHPIQFDIGRFKMNEPDQGDLMRILSPLECFLDEKSPELARYLKDEIPH